MGEEAGTKSGGGDVGRQRKAEPSGTARGPDVLESK